MYRSYHRRNYPEGSPERQRWKISKRCENAENRVGECNIHLIKVQEKKNNGIETRFGHIMS